MVIARIYSMTNQEIIILSKNLTLFNAYSFNLSPSLQ